jgi:DNA-binding GntR family transcriptional regulator
MDQTPPATPAAVRDLLTADIVAGGFAPGERLVVAVLARRYGTSAMPVRAALQELRGRGLVTEQPHQGARVRAIDAEYIANVYELRRAVLGLLIPRCVRFAGNADLDAIADLAAGFADTARGGAIAPIMAASRAFHHGVYALARNAEALDVMDRTWPLIDALRARLGFGPGRLAQAMRGHQAMLAALRRRDGREATRLFQEASDAAMNDLVALWTATPGPAPRLRKPDAGRPAAPTGLGHRPAARRRAIQPAS